MENTSKRLRAYSREIDRIANQIDTGQIEPRQKVQIGTLMMDFGKALIEDGMDDLPDDIETGAIEQAIQSNYEVVTDD
ncbi:MAG: hypothetical protein ABEI98_07595 [Halorhabdus sp.]